jgi:outer membrane receptor protein involved in Fe transport
MSTTRLLLCASALSLSASLAVPALAQVSVGSATSTPADCSPSDTRPECQANLADDSDVQTVTVTGSRIRRPNYDTPEPVTVLGSTYLDERNLTNVADALNELPSVRGSVTPNGAQGSFGQGVNFINNYGLGSNRTLTLVNGRRFVSSNVPTLFNQGSQGVQVDLNVIPTIMVDRTETLSVGGAPVYGSDAIAGTLNIILKENFEGVDLRATNQITERGDAYSFNVSALAGTKFADGRGHVQLAVSHDRQDGLRYNTRDFLRQNVGNAGNPTAAQAAGFRPGGPGFANDGRLNPSIGFNDSTSDGFPGSVLVRDRTIPLLTQGGLITAATNAAGASLAGVVQNFQFDSTGAVIPFNRGIRFLSVQEASGGDGFRFNDYLQLRSDLERDIVYGTAKFEFSPALEVFAEGTYFRSRGDELVQQPTFNSSLFSGVSGPLRFSINTPFLTDQARATLQAQGVTTFQVSRASVDLTDPTGYSENELYRGVLGARGNFRVLGNDWNYEVTGIYGKTRIEDFGQQINQQRFVNAVNNCQVTGVTAANTVTPGFLPVADAACQPLNLLGLNRASQAAKDYVFANVITNSELEQWVVNANVGGTLFRLFGNEVGVSVGYEHRDERGSFTPSDFEQQGLGRSVAIAPVAGQFNLDEVFGEVNIPLVTPQNDIPFLNRLEVFGRGRYVDNTVNGGFFSWAAGGQVAIIRDITFRGNYSRTFRAPAITELFLPRSNSFVTVTDYCSPANRNAGPAPAVRNANCTAFLAAFPNATPLDAAAATVPGVSGGNPTLDNEIADSFTYGVVIRPRFLPGFAMTVDYIDINIKNPIANLTVANIGSACFDNPDFNAADPANGNAFCSRIRRYTAADGGTAANGGPRAGQVVNDPLNPGVSTGFVNGNRIDFSGIQAGFDYDQPLTLFGLPDARINLDGTMLYVKRRLSDITGVAPAQSEGVIGDPEFTGQLNARYILDDFGLTYSFNYIGEQLYSRFNRTPDTREIDQLKDYVTVNFSMYFDIQKQFRLTMGVTNIFDRVGEKYIGDFYNPNFSDLLGRRYSVTARVRF